MGRRLSRAEEIQRFFDELEAAPKGKEVSITAAANARADEVDATGMVTMADLEGFGVASRKTIRKHIEAGDLIGRKVLVRGVQTWLFEVEHARSYLERVVGLLNQAVAKRGTRDRRAEAPAGTVTLRQLAERAGVTKWFVYARIEDGTLTADATGFKGAKLFTDETADAFVAEHQTKGRPNRLGPFERAPMPRPDKRPRRPLVITDRLVLLLVVLDQSGESVGSLARDLGLARMTVANWAKGVSEPDDDNTGRLVAHARGRYALRVGEDLDLLGREHRRRYMENYMRSRRTGP